ncbi:MAG: prefoldin subunit alpha [Candidatus Bathyarchaeia archaeon]
MSEKSTQKQLEDRFRSLVLENRYLEGLITDFQSRMSILDAAVREYATTEATISGLKELREDDEILVPMGGGSFIKAKVTDTQRVIIGVGAGTALEKPGDEAKANVQAQISQLQQLRSSIQTELMKVVERMEAVRAELNKLAGSART